MSDVQDFKASKSERFVVCESRHLIRSEGSLTLPQLLLVHVLGWRTFRLFRLGIQRQRQYIGWCIFPLGRGILSGRCSVAQIEAFSEIRESEIEVETKQAPLLRLQLPATTTRNKKIKEDVKQPLLFHKLSLIGGGNSFRFQQASTRLIFILVLFFFRLRVTDSLYLLYELP